MSHEVTHSADKDIPVGSRFSSIHYVVADDEKAAEDKIASQYNGYKNFKVDKVAAITPKGEKQSIPEGWGAETQERTRAASVAGWDALFDKHKSNPAMTAKLKELRVNNWNHKYAEQAALKTMKEGIDEGCSLTPSIAVRSLYTKSYAKNGGTAAKAKDAQSKAYDEVEKAHGKAARENLEKFHKSQRPR